jgi:hypothetical protein
MELAKTKPGKPLKEDKKKNKSKNKDKLKLKKTVKKSLLFLNSIDEVSLVIKY